MQLSINLIITKALFKLSRLLGRGGGSALPGLVAEKLDANISARLARGLSGGIILVTGTNGKTTTTKMLAAILETTGQRVLTNRSGSNLSRGIASTLIEVASLDGHLPYDQAVFEVDEASMPAVAGQLKPKAILVLNLFRDQLDRYGELDKTASLIGQAIESTEAQVYLNADDPLVASLSQYADAKRVHYFGVAADGPERMAHDHAADSDHCPFDGVALNYSQRFFSHLGHYECPKGDFARPQPQTVLTKLVSKNAGGSDLTIKAEGSQHNIKLALPGLYNAYNALGAVAVARDGGVDLMAAATALASVSAAFGRVEQLQLGGRRVYLLLIKNPTGFNQVIQTFLLGPSARRRNLLIAINDNFADGRDVSWLWDVAFEELAGQDQRIITSGIRAADMALRLKYAEIDSAVEADLAAAVKQLLQKTPSGETAYILPTYTAMLALRKLIASDAGLEGYWQ